MKRLTNNPPGRRRLTRSCVQPWSFLVMRTFHRGLGVGLLLMLLVGLALPGTARADKSPYDWALIRLDYARKEKVEQLQSSLDRMHTLAREACQDPVVVSSFDINLQYTNATAKGPVPGPLAEKVAELRDGFNRYYIEHYFTFYDILFVNRQGKVFYSIRKEADLNENLLKGNSACSELVRCLRQQPDNEVFLDYHCYGPSGEPAAFFVEPIRKDQAHVGWLILQCAANKINTLFAWTDDLGRTGETFLVNHDGFMLTESNFEGSSTILKKRLDDRNIQAKFAEKQGHRTVTDYRGHTALTSFEVVEFLGTRWLVVAKIDKDEITTQHYARHRKYYADKLLNHLRNLPLPTSSKPSSPDDRTIHRVDMDEFVKAQQGDLLHTFGISTCTGFLVASPGEFAYLAHVSTKDKVYGSWETNLVGRMLKRVRNFDIYPSEQHDLFFLVVAPHLDSLLSIVDKLLEEGFLLSQIRVVHNPHADSAKITYDYLHDDLTVAWRMPKDSDGPDLRYTKETANVGQIIERFIATEQDSSAGQ